MSELMDKSTRQKRPPSGGENSSKAIAQLRRKSIKLMKQIENTCASWANYRRIRNGIDRAVDGTILSDYY